MFINLFFANELNKKNQDLKENERLSKQLNKKLEDLANDITNSEKNLKNLAQQISKLTQENSKLEQSAKIQSQELRLLNSQNQGLLKDRNLMETRLVSLIAQDFAYDLTVPSGYLESDESFMAVEVLHSLDGILKEEFYKLSKDYEKNSKLIDEKQGKIDSINVNLKQYTAQLTKLEELKQRQLNEIKQQKADRALYAKKLDDLQKQQAELRKTLADLNIVSKSKDEKGATVSKDVKQLGSGYQKSSVKKYLGKKTIAPLEAFTVKQKFGNFTDPIYNIKLFNENVILRSKNQDARVKTVFDGKVVFAKQTNLLQKVVIVEHSNGLHTIYAHLSQIAPTVKVGKNVKKGEVIGRVKNDLSFEVTQEKFHINPLELISLN
ncbi:murein hydrolase activator EnvC family protein [Campylobacter troglodytis]|uniref:murein hydrolase activator EnvC family protein n=1 Tax=Campylobacter troglodytis TaxID=654363 RepID=UPI00115BB47E|nr:M23 family metallopeptidase [Campylobacter troglodytis]TQR60331.1 peptidase M23 [Campylobacter troglodytis]